MPENNTQTDPPYVEPKMEVINSGSVRGVRNASDLFLRFLSQDGANEYPSVILLANRIFFQKENRGGEHVGITETIGKLDDFYWYKITRLEDIKYYLSHLSRQDTGSGNAGSGGASSSMPTTASSETDGKPFFEEEPMPDVNIKKFYKSKNLYYIRKDDYLYFSKISPLDTQAEVFVFPVDSDYIDGEQDRVIQVYSLTETLEIVLTSNRLYRFDHKNNIITSLLKPPLPATGICKLHDFFIMSTSDGLYKITNIENEEEELDYEIIRHNPDAAIDDGLPEDNRFTFCFPSLGNIAEVNGLDDKS
jgi:hypothetical protein